MLTTHMVQLKSTRLGWQSRAGCKRLNDSARLYGTFARLPIT